MKILLVDDDQSMATTLKIALTQCGFEVSSTTDSLQALQRIKEQTFDCLVTDGEMPELSGFELAEKALALQPQMKRILVSGLYTDSSTARSLFSAVLKKPVNVDILAAYIMGERDGKGSEL